MSAETKSHPGPTVRIETAGFDKVVPRYGRSLDDLPAAFWATFADALAETSSEEPLDPQERALVDAARDLACTCGREVASSWPWSPYVTSPDSDDASTEDVLNVIVATLALLGLDRCRVVELVPFERLVVRVPMGATRRGAADEESADADLRAAKTRELEVRGFCAGVMDLAYGGTAVAGARRAFECRRTGAADAGEGAEFMASRRER